MNKRSTEELRTNPDAIRDEIARLEASLAQHTADYERLDRALLAPHRAAISECAVNIGTLEARLAALEVQS